MPVDLYSFRLSQWCRSVLMLGKYLGIDFDYHHVDLTDGEQFNPEYLKMNPAHCVPTLNDNGFVLWGSRAILTYLVNQYKPDSTLYPNDPKKRAIVDRWLNFDNSVSRTQDDVMFAKFKGVEVPEDKQSAHKNNLKLTDDLIGSNRYLTGDQITLADFSLLAILVFADLAGYDMSEYKNIERWRSGLKKELSFYTEVNHITEEELKETLSKFAARGAAQAKQ